MKSTRTLFVAAALFSLASLAWSHDDATLDKAHAPNGGQLRMAGIYHYELVVAPPSADARKAPVTVYVTDHAGTKIATAGATGTVTILSGAGKASIALQPTGDNVMQGEGSYKSTADMKAIVANTRAGKSAEQARFTPMAGNRP
jgi:L-ascorbate metabolism protein UlaG (beta-lactamase superfamily)